MIRFCRVGRFFERQDIFGYESAHQEVWEIWLDHCFGIWSLLRADAEIDRG
jgi:hypothetical protein